MPNGGEKQQTIAKDQERRARDNQKNESGGIDLAAAYRALIEAYERERRRKANGRQK